MEVIAQQKWSSKRHEFWIKKKITELMLANEELKKKKEEAENRTAKL